MQLSMCKNGLWTEKPLTHPESRNASESGWNSRAALVELGSTPLPRIHHPPSPSTYSLGILRAGPSKSLAVIFAVGWLGLVG